MSLFDGIILEYIRQVLAKGMLNIGDQIVKSKF